MSAWPELSIEWYREQYERNSSSIGVWAARLWEHYSALEAKLEAMERRALDMEYAADNNSEACKLLEAKLETMERALYDVAKGMVPNDFSLEGDPREIRSRLFTWSQERAREGLAAAQEEE